MLHYNGGESCLHVSETQTFKIETNDKISCHNSCLGSVSEDFTKDEQSEISLHDTVYCFSVDHSSFKKMTFLIFTNFQWL